MGYGLSRTGSAWWLLAGVAWAGGALLLGLLPDTRHKAFIQRLKRLEGSLLVAGGGGERPAPPSTAPRGLLRRAMWLGRKACEPHLTMNLLMLLALLSLLPGVALWPAMHFTALMAMIAPVLAAG